MEMSIISRKMAASEMSRDTQRERSRDRATSALAGVSVVKPKATARAMPVSAPSRPKMELDDATLTFDPRNIPKSANIDTRNPKQVNAFMASRCVEMRLDLNRNTMLSGIDRRAILDTIQQQIGRMDGKEFRDLQASRIRENLKGIRSAISEGRPVSDRQKAVYAQFNARVDEFMEARAERGAPIDRKEAVRRMVDNEAKRWLSRHKEVYSAYLEANSMKSVIRTPSDAAMRSIREQFSSGVEKVAAALPPRLKAGLGRVAEMTEKLAASVKKSTDTLKDMPAASAGDTNKERQFSDGKERQFFDGMIEGMGRFSDRGSLEYNDPATSRVNEASGIPAPRQTFRSVGERAANVTSMVNEQVARPQRTSVVDEFMGIYGGVFAGLKIDPDKELRKSMLDDLRRVRAVPEMGELAQVLRADGRNYSSGQIREIHRDLKQNPLWYRAFLDAKSLDLSKKNIPRVGTYTPEPELAPSYAPRMR